MTTSDSLLYRALKWNAGFSAASAVLMVISARWLATQLGLPGPLPIYLVAALLVVFAAQLGNIVRTRGKCHGTDRNRVGCTYACSGSGTNRRAGRAASYRAMTTGERRYRTRRNLCSRTEGRTERSE